MMGESKHEEIFIRSSDVDGGCQQEGWLNISDLQKALGEWAEKTFPMSSLYSVMEHLKEGVGEHLKCA